VRVAACDLENGGPAAIVTAPGFPGGPHVKAFDASGDLLGGPLGSFLAFDPGFLGGVFVGCPGEQGLRITSATAVTFTVGTAGSFTVTTAGTPPATGIAASGALPAGVTFTDHGDGTATLAGTAGVGTGGVYPLALTATNGVTADATQAFTLTVEEAPAITSANAEIFQIGAANSFVVTTRGFPVPGLTQSGAALPSGVTFTDHGDGTATLGGTPAGGTAGTYALTIEASNAVGSADQAFALTVQGAPIVSAATFSVPENSPNGTVVGTVTFTDPDVGQTHTFAITAGNTGGAFAINPTTGQLTVATLGALDFETTPSFGLTVQVTDSGVPPLSGSATITVTLTNVNEPPVVSGTDFSVGENAATGTAVGPLVTVADPDAGQTHTFSIIGGNTGGAFAINASTGQFTVANGAALDFETTPTFVLTVQGTDNGTPPLSGTTTVTVTLVNGNDAPVVIPATFSVPENSAAGMVVGTVTFTDPDAGQTHTFAITGGNTGGAFAIDPGTGQITVATPVAVDFETTPSFSLTVEVTDDGVPPRSGSATITVNLTDVNETPVVNAATFGVAENSAVGTVVGTVTFTDPDAGQGHSFAITAGNTNTAFAIAPGTGQITVNNTAALDFETTPTFSLTVEVTDTGGPPLTGGATITITLGDVNDAPVVNAATFSIAENSANGTAVGTVTFTDADPGQTHTFAITAGNTNAAFAIAGGTGQITVATPAAVDFETTPTFSLTVEVTDNGSPTQTGTATITVNLTNVNDAPVAQSQTETLAEDAGATTITLHASDVDDLTLAFAIVSPPTHGGVSVVVPGGCTPDGSGGAACTATVQYTPNANFSGTDSFTFKATDGGPLDSNTATISITVNAMADAPVANTQSVSTTEDTPKLITLSGTDPDGDTLTFAIATGPSQGSVGAVTPQLPCTVDGAGASTCTATVTYTPAGNYNGPDSFTFTVNDGTVDSAPGTVNITVVAANDPPVAADKTATTAEDTPTTITLSATDIDTLTLTFAVVTGPTHGTLQPIGPVTCVPDGSGGTSCTADVTYTPAADYQGPDSFTYTASDGLADSLEATVTLTVTPAPDAPTAVAQSVMTDEGVALLITLTGTDPDSLALTFSPGTDPTNGVLGGFGPPVCTPDGSGGTSCTATVTYTPNADYFGSDSFTFTVNDGSLTSPPGTVSITVNGINDAPSFTKGADQTVNEDAVAQSVPGWATAISPGPNESGQAVNFIVSNDNTALFSAQPAISPTGTLTYTPAANQHGLATVSVQIHDDGGVANGGVDTSAVQTFTITVTAVNDAPSFTKGADQTVNEDAVAQSVPGWATAISPGPSDEAGQAVNFIVSNNNNSLFSVQPAVSPTGTLTYTPAANQHGLATVSVQIHDDGGVANGGVDTSAVQTFTITVTAVNDAPSFTKGADQPVNEDAVAQNVPGWATAISPGPNESGQAVNFIVSNDNTALFSAQPAVSPTGTLTYTPAANQFGAATVSVQIHDDGGVTNGGVDTSAVQTFTITVNAVNDPPTAQAQSYTAQANMSISIAAGSGLLVGAADAADVAGNAAYTPVFTVGTVNGVAPVAGVITTTVAGMGTFTVTASTGAFTFDPAPGVTGTVATTYTVCDSGEGAPASRCSATASLQFTINAPVIWFVAPNLGANGTGTLASPFNVLASANTAKGANANHRIFVYHSTTPATAVSTEAGVGVTLDAAGSQWLVGQGVTGTSFDTVMGLTGGSAVPAGTIARPGINGTRPVIQGTVAMNGNNSVVRGLNITPSTAGAQGLTGGAVTGVTTGEVDVATTTGSAVNLNGTGGTVDLGNVSSTTGTAVSITGGTGTVTVAGTVSRTTAGGNPGISVASRTSGTVTFSGATKTLNTGTGAAVSLTSNGAATINFTNGGLDIDTTSGAGFSATGGGTVNVTTGTNANTITSGSGTALNVVSTTIGASGLTFGSISANGASSGIVLDGTGSNGLTVGGGTIQNTTGSGIKLTNANNISLTNVTVNTTGSAASSTPVGQTGALDGHGIDMRGGSNLTLTGVQVLNAGAGDNEHGVYLFNATGTVSVQNTTIANAEETLLHVDSNNNSSLTLDVGTVTASTFTHGALIGDLGSFTGNGILFTARGTSNYTINIQNSTFNNIKGFAFQFGGDGTAAGTNTNITINNNDFLTTVVNVLGNLNNRANTINIQGRNTIDIDASITNNLIDGGGGGGIQLGADESSNIHASITGNTVQDQFADGILIGVDENAHITVLIDGNDISNTSSDGMELSNGISPGGTSTLNATITNNTVTGHNNNAGANAFVAGIAVFGGADAADNTNLDIRNNNVSGNPNPGVFFDYFTQGFGDTILVEGPGALAVAEAQFLAPGTLNNVSGSPAGGRTFLADVFFNNNTNVPLPVFTP
jgi:VCBS repeat-containing protein